MIFCYVSCLIVRHISFMGMTYPTGYRLRQTLAHPTPVTRYIS